MGVIVDDASVVLYAQDGFKSLINGLALLEKLDGYLYIYSKFSHMFFSMPHSNDERVALAHWNSNEINPAKFPV